MCEANMASFPVLVILAITAGIDARLEAARQQKEAVARVTKLGGKVYYDYQRHADTLGRFVIHPKKPLNVPEPLRKRFGDDFFCHVIVVEVRESDATDDDVKVIASRLPYILSLDLSYTRVTDASLGHLKKLRRLEGLVLTGTRVTDAGMEHIAGLKQMKQLGLWKTAVGDEGCKHIGKLTNLQTLMLDETKVTDAGVTHLGKLTELDDWLGLVGTKVTNNSLPVLSGFRKLKHLNLRKTQVTADAVQTLQRALPKTEISVGP
jgi:hypothetical protein